jgi:hypothetical protein
MSLPYSGKYINCKTCNKEFYLTKSRIDIAKYCSRKCKDNAYEGGCKINCIVCKNEFLIPKYRLKTAKYCSMNCRNQGLCKFGIPNINISCGFCSKIFKDSPSRRRIFCSKKCSNIYRMSQLDEPKYPNSFRSFWERRGIIIKCEKCGYDKCKEILGIHHIDHNRNNNKRTNLIVLCPNCHSLEHRQHIPH